MQKRKASKKQKRGRPPFDNACTLDWIWRLRLEGLSLGKVAATLNKVSSNYHKYRSYWANKMMNLKNTRRINWTRQGVKNVLGRAEAVYLTMEAHILRTEEQRKEAAEYIAGHRAERKETEKRRQMREAASEARYKGKLATDQKSSDLDEQPHDPEADYEPIRFGEPGKVSSSVVSQRGDERINKK